MRVNVFLQIHSETDAQSPVLRDGLRDFVQIETADIAQCFYVVNTRTNELDATCQTFPRV